ncbi:MAG TPA: TonB family protein [Terriglobia bacterium]|nr:TonB family protein [Terriglobia bacterium]
MGTHLMVMVDERRDNLRGTLLLSFILHGALFVVLLTYTMLGFHLGGGGREWGTEGATRMGAVSSLPGIPLPSPLLTTPSQVATQNTGVYKTEPQPKEVAPPDAQEIPKFKDAVKPEKLERVNKRIHKTEEVPPDNAVPYGQSGAPTMNYTQVVTSAGTGGVAMGEANSFGQRYAWYVASMRSRISANWLLATVSPNILTAPRTYITFEITRDGTVTNVQITQSSGIAEVDRSAFRAILASNPLPPLPPDYSGGSVNVQFYFDFHRQ